MLACVCLCVRVCVFVHVCVFVSVCVCVVCVCVQHTPLHLGCSVEAEMLRVGQAGQAQKTEGRPASSMPGEGS